MRALIALLMLTLSLHAGDQRPPRQPYSIEQAISDQAQLHTIAFSGLAFITGDFGAATFLPPGKVCDYFGFQYMRDIDAAQKGHNPAFLNRVAGSVLQILNDDQRTMLTALAREQAVPLDDLVRTRWPLIHAFQRELDGKRPAGSSGLDRTAVRDYVGEIFAIDASLSYRRAHVFGRLAASLTDDQKAYLGKMQFGNFDSWPAVDAEKLKLRDAPHLQNVAYMTYASEFYSWYAGSIEADTYFCPERHGTYFGGFYMKDMPAMGKRDFDISTTVTGDSGKAFLEALTPEQRTQITGLIDQQRKTMREIVETRRQIATRLRGFLNGQPPEEAEVVALGKRYGQLDGQISADYAAAFAVVNRSLSVAQRTALVKLRNLDGYASAKAYVYSRPFRGTWSEPDSDRFFLVAP